MFNSGIRTHDHAFIGGALYPLSYIAKYYRIIY